MRAKRRTRASPRWSRPCLSGAPKSMGLAKMVSNSRVLGLARLGRTARLIVSF